MGEYMKQILRQQIAAEPARFSGADETGGTFCLNFHIIGIPLKEAENRILIQGV